MLNRFVRWIWCQWVGCISLERFFDPGRYTIYNALTFPFALYLQNADRLRNSMMDIYAHGKRLKHMRTTFQKLDQPDRYSFAIMIKTYGKMQQPERADEVVRSMIENPLYPNPDIDTINCLLNAWADAASNHPNSAERAFNVYQWIYDDPEVELLNLRPTVVTYSNLLKCLASSSKGVHDVGRKVDMIMKNMEYRKNAGDVSCRPNEIFYTVAIKACLRANDFQQAEAILQRMEQQSESESSEDVAVRPNVRTYSEFLMFYSRLGTVSAAERTTQIHDQMRKLSQTIDPSLKPNVYTYNMVLNGWALTNDASAGDQMWKIYEQMVNVDQVELNKYNYTTLLTFYSKSKRLQDVQRGIQLLQAMQNSRDSDVYPQRKHFEMVLSTCMRSGAAQLGSEVMISFLEAYSSGKFVADGKKPNPKFYPWIVTRLLRSNDLVGASRFVLETFVVTKDKKGLDEVGFVPDLVMQLRREWTSTNHVDKGKYLDQLSIFN
jgi:pentatricopeptide repeat protein